MGADMTNSFDQEAIESGPDGIDLQAMARRQFVASVAVAIVIGLGAILIALAPASRDYASDATHRVAAVQQPKFAPQTVNSLAAATRRRDIELP
jgi:uncharacterized protein involved in exopolysaccharide biosynthesis